VPEYGGFATTNVDDVTIESNAEGRLQVKDGGVAAAKLAADSVETAKIVDANITAAKLAADSIETAKIVDANITAAKLAADSVTSDKIADSTFVETLATSLETAKVAKAEYLTWARTYTVGEITEYTFGSIDIGSVRAWNELYVYFQASAAHATTGYVRLYEDAVLKLELAVSGSMAEYSGNYQTTAGSHNYIVKVNNPPGTNFDVENRYIKAFKKITKVIT